ncbi:MAG TPA: HlyD family efflux transporter periplasmic adaptor subunit [Polyangiaceae bacterium]|nr:HlyD family efflux transporter periplasmic adaptor subunit [Polyangiaceae bacterium]
MTRKPDEPSAPAGADRVTRRGLGFQDPRRTTGAFPVDRPEDDGWPQLSESPEPPLVAPSAASARDPEEITSNWQRPQSRGPEYHPPVAPAAPRGERMSGPRTNSGTFRVGSPPSRPVLPDPPPNRAQESQRIADAPPSWMPVERSVLVGRSSAPPLLSRLGSRRVVVPILAGLVVGSTLALALVHVPVRAWGVLRTSGAPEALSAPLAGSVAKLRVAAGDSVEAGDVILELRNPELDAALGSRRAELERLRQESDSASREDQAALSRTLAALARRRDLLEQRLQLKDAEYEQRKALLDALTSRVGAGAAQPAELFEPAAAVQGARAERLGIVDELAQLDLDVSDRRSAGQAREAARAERLAELEARVLQAQSALDAGAVRAPAAGWVESLLVSAGSNVQPGSELARLVPRATPRSVVALLASSEASEVAAGEDASVELVAPYREETSALPARVRYVSKEVAPRGRVQAILGEAEPGGFVQVELELLDSPELQAVQPQLRSGSRALVSLSVPERSLGNVLLLALRQWWDFGLWS